MTMALRLACAGILLAGLSVDTAAADEFRTVTDRGEFLSLVRDRSLEIRMYGIDLKVAEDGRIEGRGAGRPVTGQWRWVGSHFCRDLYWGSRDLGPNCQEVQVSGNTMRFTSDRGEGRSADFRLR